MLSDRRSPREARDAQPLCELFELAGAALRKDVLQVGNTPHRIERAQPRDGLRRLLLPPAQRAARRQYAHRRKVCRMLDQRLFGPGHRLLILACAEMGVGGCGLHLEELGVLRAETDRVLEIDEGALWLAAPDAHPPAIEPAKRQIRVELKGALYQSDAVMHVRRDIGEDETCRAERDGVVAAQL